VTVSARIIKKGCPRLKAAEPSRDYQLCPKAVAMPLAGKSRHHSRDSRSFVVVSASDYFCGFI